VQPQQRPLEDSYALVFTPTHIVGLLLPAGLDGVATASPEVKISRESMLHRSHKDASSTFVLDYVYFLYLGYRLPPDFICVAQIRSPSQLALQFTSNLTLLLVRKPQITLISRRSLPRCRELPLGISTVDSCGDYRPDPVRSEPSILNAS
jgi:hypothetical protein